MKVEFSFKDKHGTIKMENNKELNLNSEHLLALLNSNQVTYPYKMGDSLSVKKAEIENIEFDMYRETDIKLRVELIEK
ncbi:hypothetical protein [Fictibacillus phosphorivorans]|uniref:hypothetical protein n=1 Tax=Fictibacillus phosphorivorans TaxID=1221500 RepID=UPI0035E8EBE7